MLILFPFIYTFPCLFFLAFTTFSFSLHSIHSLFSAISFSFLLSFIVLYTHYSSCFEFKLFPSFYFLMHFSDFIPFFFSTPFIYVMSKRGTFCSKFCLCLPTRVSSQRHRAHLTLSHPTCITGVQSALASDG